jgi:hypothetical protein
VGAEHKAIAEHLISVAPTSKAYTHPERVVVGIDENLNHNSVWMMLGGAVATGHVSTTVALWHELRKQESGKHITVNGGYPTGVVYGFDWGHRVQGDRLIDPEVVDFALTHLYTYRRVVLLSADQKRGPQELRGILRRDVAPVMNSRRDHGLSLVLLRKLPNSPLKTYADKVWSFLVAAQFESGFDEEAL